jgi:predicted amidohydrolase
MTTFGVAAVVPRTRFGDGAREANLESARKAALGAAQEGAQLVCFPETVPGQWRRPLAWDPVEDLKSIAVEAGVYLVGGFAEAVEGDPDRGYNTLVLIDPDGNEVGRYRRTSPGIPGWLYANGPQWDFDWVAATELPVFDTALGRIGMLVCSEVYVPELSRALALKGADVIVMPAGLTAAGSPLYATWHNLVWSRAIENLVYTVVSSNSLGSGGMAMICSPEAILADSTDEGVHVATVDLDRLRYLREEQDRRGVATQERPWLTKPGVLRDWRVPAVWRGNPILWEFGDEETPA